MSPKEDNTQKELESLKAKLRRERADRIRDKCQRRKVILGWCAGFSVLFLAHKLSGADTITQWLSIIIFVVVGYSIFLAIDKKEAEELSQLPDE